MAGNYIPTQSPWLSAGNTANDLGATFGNFMINMARLRAEQALQDRNAMLQARQLEMQERMGKQRLDLQRELNKSHQGLYDAQAGKIKFGQEAASKYGVASRVALAPPVDMTQGPTREAAQSLGAGDLIETRAILSALNPSVLQKQVQPVELNQGANLVDPLIGNLIAQGQSKPQAGFKLSPGQTQFDPTGSPVASLPLAPGNDPLLKLLPALASVIGHGNSTIEGLDKAMVPNYEQGPVYHDATNQMAQASALLSALLPQAQAKYGGPTNAPSTKPRVRVRGPNGETGTVEQGDTLPQGWQVIQ